MYLLSNQSGHLVCSLVKPLWVLLDLRAPVSLKGGGDAVVKWTWLGPGAAGKPWSGSRGLQAWLWAPGPGGPTSVITPLCGRGGR